MTYNKTPTITEIDELEILYRMADELFYETFILKTKKPKKNPHNDYIKRAEYLDSFPVVGNYYRELCKNIISK